MVPCFSTCFHGLSLMILLLLSFSDYQVRNPLSSVASWPHQWNSCFPTRGCPQEMVSVLKIVVVLIYLINSPQPWRVGMPHAWVTLSLQALGMWCEPDQVWEDVIWALESPLWMEVRVCSCTAVSVPSYSFSVLESSLFVPVPRWKATPILANRKKQFTFTISFSLEAESCKSVMVTEKNGATWKEMLN